MSFSLRQGVRKRLRRQIPHIGKNFPRTVATISKFKFTTPMLPLYVNPKGGTRRHRGILAVQSPSFILTILPDPFFRFSATPSPQSLFTVIRNILLQFRPAPRSPSCKTSPTRAPSSSQLLSPVLGVSCSASWQPRLLVNLKSS